MDSDGAILQMNNQTQGKDRAEGLKEAFNIKPSTIRIWIHDKDIGKLTRVLWEGQGIRLRTETSNNPKVKKFLDNVPHIMGHIKDIHGAVIDNDLDLLIAKTSPPVPAAIVSSKDANGLTALHKASGLAHTRLVEYLLSIWPNAATEEDFTGKTPLHWAAGAKNNDRCFNLLVQAGSDETAVDHKNRTPVYYKSKPNDIDRSLLTVVPEAARIAQQGLPPNFDWNMLGELDVKSKNPPRRIDQFFTPNNLVTGSLDKLPIAKVKRSPPQDVLEPDEMDNKTDSGFENSPVSNITSNRIASSISSTRAQVEREAVLAAIDQIDHVYKHTPFVSRNNSKNSLDEDQPVEVKAEKIDYAIIDAAKLTNGHLEDTSETTPELNYDGDVDEDDIRNVQEQLEESVDSMGADFDDHMSHVNTNKEHAVRSEDTDEAEKEVSDITKKEDDIEPESPFKVVKRRESNKEPVTALASDDLNKHVYPDTPLDTEQPIANTDVSKFSKSSSEEKLNIERIGSSSSNKSEKQMQRPSSSVSASSKAQEVLPNSENVTPKSPEKPEDAYGNELFDNEFVEDDDVVVGVLLEQEVKEDDEKNDEQQAKDSDENVESPTAALEIAGTVEGEADNNQLESQGGDLQVNTEVDEKIKAIIDSGDMEQLAVIVLNGEGDKLIGLTSQTPEIQAFLNNVPIYMNKIRKVHIASREGSLRDLQSALDRRKFAIARDEISPHKATPLHVAAVFGHSGIVRYLGGRFPETTSAVDENGRTPLHYAATIHDNGHFYNLLMHLGSNPKIEDNNGHTAEFFTNHTESDSVLSHKQLLRDYGAEEELADEMLSDQEFNSNQVEIPLFRTEEGRYLATTLGDPLIKGLTEVANKRPADPIAFLANYLYNFTNQPKPRTVDHPSTSSANHVNVNSIETIEAKPVKMEPTLTKPEVAIAAKPQFNDTSFDDASNSSDGPESAPSSEDRDEHGQSMLHFACARSHGKNALFQLIEETGTSITFRDELYRTARDVSLQATQPDNAKEIDRYVINLAARGHYDIFGNMLLDGYDHIVDVTDTDGTVISEVARARGHTELAQFLSTIRDFEENREKLLSAVRTGKIEIVKEILQGQDGSKLVRAKNYYGRTALHVAVLTQHEDMVEYLASTFRITLRLGDNLERTALHYAMGVASVEALSRILIKNGAKRVLKDLKGRQPSYYFMNKADILRLQEEEAF